MCIEGGFRRRGRVLSGSHRHQNGVLAAEYARPATTWFGVAQALAGRVRTIEDGEEIVGGMGADWRPRRSRPVRRHPIACAPRPRVGGRQGAVIQAAPAPDAGAALEDAVRGPDHDFVVAERGAPGDTVGRGCKSLSGGEKFGLAKGAELWREFVSARRAVRRLSRGRAGRLQRRGREPRTGLGTLHGSSPHGSDFWPAEAHLGSGQLWGDVVKFMGYGQFPSRQVR